MCCLHGATPTTGGEGNAYGVRSLVNKYLSMACDISPVASRRDASDGAEQRSVATIRKLAIHS